VEALSHASCPFCKGNITADLIQFGGNCPHCLLEIPGEEAPTDPGLVARNKLAAEAALKAKSARSKNLVVTSIVLLFLGAIGGAGFWQMQQEKASRMYEMPDELYMPSLQEAAVPVVAAAPDAPKSKEKRKPNGTANAGTAANGSNTTDELPDLSTVNGTASASTSGMTGSRRASGATTAADASVTMSTATNLSLSTDATPALAASSSGPLTDETEIRNMIQRLMTRYNLQIQNCYNNRLKQNPELAGAWKLSFTIRKDGLTRSVHAEQVNIKDATLEACMEKTVTAWKFAALAQEQPVTKTIRFGASGW
jgi:hypothetical protein